MKFLFKICMIFCLLFTGIILLADSVVILKDGSRITGKVEKKNNMVIVENPILGKLSILKKNIKSIIPMGEITSLDEKAQSQKANLPDQDIIMNEIIRFVPGSINSIEEKNRPKTVAIKKIKITGKYNVNDKVFETKLINKIVERNYFTIVERQALNIILEEQELSLSGLTVEEENKVGKLLGVDSFLDISLHIPNDYSIDSTMKIVDVEKNNIIWQDDFSGNYTGDLKLAVGATYTLPISYEFKGSSFAGTEIPFEVKSKTGNVIGLTVRMGQRLRFTRFIELGLVLNIYESDFGSKKGSNKKTYYETQTNVHVDSSSGITNKETQLIPWELSGGSFKSIVNVAFLLKFHPSELFNSSKDFISIYVGAGLNMDSFSYIRKSSSIDELCNKNLQSAMIVTGLELKFFNQYSIFAEYIHLTSDSAVTDDRGASVKRDSNKIKFGLMYYIFK